MYNIFCCISIVAVIFFFVYVVYELYRYNIYIISLMHNMGSFFFQDIITRWVGLERRQIVMFKSEFELFQIFCISSDEGIRVTMLYSFFFLYCILISRTYRYTQYYITIIHICYNIDICQMNCFSMTHKSCAVSIFKKESNINLLY